MVGSFSLCDDHGNPYRFPGERLIERNPRIDIRALARVGGLVEGTETRFCIHGGGRRCACEGDICRVVREPPGVTINGTGVVIDWDEPMPGVSRPWFLCPCGCGRRARFLYLIRDMVRAAPCLGLQHASRHVGRQTRGGPARVARLRRRLGDCPVEPFAPLPTGIWRGRSRAYHQRLIAQIYDEELKLLDQLSGLGRDLSRRLRVRKARHQW